MKLTDREKAQVLEIVKELFEVEEDLEEYEVEVEPEIDKNREIYIKKMTESEFNKLRGLKSGTVVYVHPEVKKDYAYFKIVQEAKIRGLIIKEKE